MHELQLKKQILTDMLREATHKTFMATQQDDLGGWRRIEEAKKHESFIAEWLGEIQNQIDNLNKGEE